LSPLVLSFELSHGSPGHTDDEGETKHRNLLQFVWQYFNRTGADSRDPNAKDIKSFFAYCALSALGSVVFHPLCRGPSTSPPRARSPVPEASVAVAAAARRHQQEDAEQEEEAKAVFAALGDGNGVTRVPEAYALSVVPPLFLQHDGVYRCVPLVNWVSLPYKGHSRTIIGIERRKNGSYTLLIFGACDIFASIF
jgi:hypothetical protein